MEDCVCCYIFSDKVLEEILQRFMKVYVCRRQQLLPEETLKRKLEKSYVVNNVLDIQIQIVIRVMSAWDFRGFTVLDRYYQNYAEEQRDSEMTSLLCQAGARRGRSSSHSELSIRKGINQWSLGYNPRHGPPVGPVNSTNRMGFMALDLPCGNFTKQNRRPIGLALCHQSVPNSMVPTNQWLLIAASFIAGFTYSSIFKLNDTDVVTEARRIRDVISHPNLLPVGFYYIMFTTVLFTASMVGVVVPLWSLIQARSFCFRALQFLGLGSFFFSYAFTMNEKVPKFWVTAESFKISSFWLVWLFVQPLILMLVMIWLVAKQILPFFPSFANRTNLTLGGSPAIAILRVCEVAETEKI